jgi:hypothetical protein
MIPMRSKRDKLERNRVVRLTILLTEPTMSRLRDKLECLKFGNQDNWLGERQQGQSERFMIHPNIECFSTSSVHLFFSTVATVNMWIVDVAKKICLC